MSGKGLQQVSPDTKEKARELRRSGRTIESIATELSVSSGAVSTWCRGIIVTRPESRKRVTKTPVESSAKVLERVPESEPVIELANQVKEAELQARLRRLQATEEEDAQRREYNEDLRRRLKEAETREAEARAKAFGSSTEGNAQVEAARAESQRLREQLNEQRHQEQMSELSRNNEAQISALARMFQGGGLGRFDIMAKALDKLDNTVQFVGSKVDLHLARSRGNSDFMMALKLGLSPAELNILKQGEETPMSRGQYDILRVGMPEADFGSFEAWTARTMEHNRLFRELSARVSQRLTPGRTDAKVSPGKTGEPEPGPEQPAILDAETRLVTCTRCGSVFDVDLAEVRLKAKPGVKLYVHCANEKCNFLLDVTELVGPVEQVEKPECFSAGENGKCAAYQRTYKSDRCGDCKYLVE